MIIENKKIKISDPNNYKAIITIKNDENNNERKIKAEITLINNKKLERDTEKKIKAKKEKNDFFEEYYQPELTYIKEILKKIANSIND